MRNFYLDSYVKICSTFFWKSCENFLEGYKQLKPKGINYFHNQS